MSEMMWHLASGRLSSLPMMSPASDSLAPSTVLLASNFGGLGPRMMHPSIC